MCIFVADLLHICCIFVHISGIFLHIRCISGAYLCLFVAYLFHIFCIFVHIFAHFLHISCIFLHTRCIQVHIRAYICIFIHISAGLQGFCTGPTGSAQQRLALQSSHMPSHHSPIHPISGQDHDCPSRNSKQQLTAKGRCLNLAKGRDGVGTCYFLCVYACMYLCMCACVCLCTSMYVLGKQLHCCGTLKTPSHPSW